MAGKEGVFDNIFEVAMHGKVDLHGDRPFSAAASGYRSMPRDSEPPDIFQHQSLTSRLIVDSLMLQVMYVNLITGSFS